MSSVIVPAVKAGRRVVTNVDGINSDAIRAYCQEKFSVPMEQLGEVLHCSNDDVPKASFLPHGQEVDTFCQPGDLICIDEAWRFWGTDVLLFSGTQPEIEKLQELLPQIDVATGEVLVRGLVYEVSRIDKSGSAFGLLANLLGGKLNLGIGSAVGNLGNFIQLQNTALDAVYSMLETDSRFKVISLPSLRIQSGARGVFSVGQDAPVLGALWFSQGAGQAVQSVEYRSSGVIFGIRPTVRNSVIEMAISQQLSNFIKTTTGVNNSPTLTKRELKTTVGLHGGDVIVLGGLAEDKTSSSRDGLSFLADFLHTEAMRCLVQRSCLYCRRSG